MFIVIFNFFMLCKQILLFNLYLYVTRLSGRALYYEETPCEIKFIIINILLIKGDLQLRKGKLKVG